METKIARVLDEDGAPTDKWYGSISTNNGTDHVTVIVSPLLDNRISARNWCAHYLITEFGWSVRDARRLVVEQNPAN
jgi:hypothetical protein